MNSSLKDNKTVTSVRLEPAASRSRVKHSTTKPLCSLQKAVQGRLSLHLSKSRFLGNQFIMILYILGYENARTAVADYVSTPSSTVTAKVGLVP